MTKYFARGYLFVFIAACLWGTIGICFRVLHDEYGLSALTLAFLRAGCAAAISLVAMAIFRPGQLRIARRSLGFFIGYGLIGIALFYWLYAQAIILTSVTTAVVLLYTAPAFVTLIAWRTMGESLDTRKAIALALAFGGCVLVARAYDPAQLSLNLVGIALGLGSGLAYALYTIFSKLILRQYSPWTALNYELLFGALFLALLQTPADFAPLINYPRAWIYLAALVFGPTLGAIIFFNVGLSHVPASNASITATIEPVVASAIAFIFLGERMEALQILGGVMVIGGAIWINLVEPTAR